MAAAAGTTERTLFKHFGSKEGLARAVIEQALLPHLAPTSLDALRRVIEAHEGDFIAWHEALLASRDEALSRAPELTRLLLVEILRDDTLRARFTDQWLPAVWAPLLGLFSHLQRQGRLQRDIGPDILTRLFLSLNLGYLVGRHVMAPGAFRNDAAERRAIARLFARGAGWSPAE